MILPSHSIIRIPFHIEYIYLIFVKKKNLKKIAWKKKMEGWPRDDKNYELLCAFSNIFGRKINNSTERSDIVVLSTVLYYYTANHA